MLHAGGRGHGKENSLAAMREGLTYRPDILELDIRQSRDGVLFCYHGFNPVSFVAAYFLRFLRFSFIQKIIRVNALTELIAEIPPTVITFLDIKDRHIPAKRIETACARHAGPVWLAAYSVPYLHSLRRQLGKRFTYVFNFSFLHLEKGIEAAAKAGTDIIKLRAAQCRPEIIEKLGQQGLRFAIHPAGLTAKRYLQLLKEVGSAWVCVDDMRSKKVLRGL
ncbi:MAG: Glycerophosphoryl diester phosphodiesterase [Candidatus Magasanikbacteria bacterium GW2011_GWA2_56_11]|uniref:Glycerophosphoryl diester phosphodiesterase n=1 Tax=Candidatus Magasanikbacteria bacterium GW2011_GWA2_56_11 TaxID=1619044 RepID=A0A0G1YF52_9BACT|nr:MAG: Glycerophosphoryl diester phosphodiesterase [Candidatus Magasanikbacteria bacterium GW2011_GWA2_56_11]